MANQIAKHFAIFFSAHEVSTPTTLSAAISYKPKIR